MPIPRVCFAILALFTLLTGCAFNGNIAEKRSQLRPDSSMIGTEGTASFVFRGPTGTSRPPITVPIPQLWTETGGSDTFLLRDQNGVVRSQMVTSEVAARYRVGDYFNDQPAGPRPCCVKHQNTTSAKRQPESRAAEARTIRQGVSSTRSNTTGKSTQTSGIERSRFVSGG